jgi:tRNA pseudouridine38-40 synthase
MRYKLTIEYDGSAFVGWQVQNNGRSVQGVLEEAVLALCGVPTRVHGAGRTDAGVHATGQVAHVDIEGNWDAGMVLRALNARLPDDVALHAVEEVDEDFHARFSASSRMYQYTIAHQRLALRRHTCWMLYGAVEHDAICQAVPALLGSRDFTSVSKFTPDLDHAWCHVFDARWESDGATSVFTIRANRFLHGMVRALVGGLVAVGRGKCSPAEFVDMLEVRDRSRTPMLAPPQGLVLTAVAYDAEERALVREQMRILGASAEE